MELPGIAAMIRRVQNEPVWLLHHRPYQDSSRILEVLSHDYGRLSLVARGSRSGNSRLKGILRPFLPLRASWVSRSDLGTLTGAELGGAPIALSGEALLSGYYANELLLHLLHRHDPQPDIFRVYGTTIENLSGGRNVPLKLRQFELELLRLLGYALNLDHDTDTRAPLSSTGFYVYRPEQGPVAATDPSGPMTFSGGELIAIRERDFSRAETLRSAGRLLRDVIEFHLGGRELKSRKVFREMRRGSRSSEKDEP
jgi:DNA repair protein RecO (recombination protein O)